MQNTTILVNCTRNNNKCSNYTDEMEVYHNISTKTSIMGGDSLPEIFCNTVKAINVIHWTIIFVRQYQEQVLRRVR